MRFYDQINCREEQQINVSIKQIDFDKDNCNKICHYALVLVRVRMG